MATAAREFTSYDENDVAAMEALGMRIKLSRMQKKMSQGELSEKTGIKIHTIRAYEAGRVNIPYTMLVKVAIALDLDASFVFYGGNLHIGNTVSN